MGAIKDRGEEVKKLIGATAVLFCSNEDDIGIFAQGIFAGLKIARIGNIESEDDIEKLIALYLEANPTALYERLKSFRDLFLTSKRETEIWRMRLRTNGLDDYRQLMLNLLDRMEKKEQESK